MNQDFILGETRTFPFTTRAFSTGAPTVLVGTPVISVYENATLTEITAGVSLSVDHDGRVGFNMITVIATTGNGFEIDKQYHLVITAGTVGGVSVVGEVVGGFSLGLTANQVWDAELSAASHNIASSAGKRLRLASEIVQLDSAVDDPGAAATTTVFNTDLTEVDDFWNDALLVFTSGALSGQTKPISNYAQINGQITLDEPLVAVPLDGVTFAIISDHVHPVSQISDAILNTQMTESYAANGVAPTLAQAQFAIHQALMQFGYVGLNWTVRKLDNSTTAFVVTLDDSTNPTDAGRI